MNFACAFKHFREFAIAEVTRVVQWWQHFFSGGSDGKESACSVGELGSLPGLRKHPEEGNGNPCQYSGLENSMDRGTWQATVHGITKSWTWLNSYRVIGICSKQISVCRSKFEMIWVRHLSYYLNAIVPLMSTATPTSMPVISRLLRNLGTPPSELNTVPYVEMLRCFLQLPEHSSFSQVEKWRK